MVNVFEWNAHQDMKETINQTVNLFQNAHPNTQVNNFQFVII